MPFKAMFLKTCVMKAIFSLGIRKQSHGDKQIVSLFTAHTAYTQWLNIPTMDLKLVY